MMKKLEIQIFGIKSFNEKIKLETEIDVLEGIKDSRVNEKAGTLVVEFDDTLIPKEKIFGKIKELGYQIKEISLLKPSLQEFVYYVKGIHCASCELLIEKELLKIKNIKSVEASTNKGTVRIVYQGERLKIQRLNSIFKKYGYTFFEKPIKLEKTNYFTNVLLPAVLVIFLFFALKNSPLASLVNVTSSSSLPTFFFFGLFAGFSTCAALVVAFYFL
jgi:Cu+-exporting ATPase